MTPLVISPKSLNFEKLQLRALKDMMYNPSVFPNIRASTLTTNLRKSACQEQKILSNFLESEISTPQQLKFFSPRGMRATTGSFKVDHSIFSHN